MAIKIWIFLGLALLCGQVAAADIGVYASEEAPYLYVEPSTGQPAGFALEVVQLLLNEMGSHAAVQVQPWPRMKKYAMTKPNNLTFLAFRTEETELKYRWVGALVPLKIFVYRLKARQDVQAQSVSELNNYRIGVAAEGGRFRYLTKHGLASNLDIANNNESNLRKFFHGRFDILLEDPTMLLYSAQRYGLDFSQAEKLFEITDLAAEGYLAFTLGTPDELVEQYSLGLQKIKAGPAYQALLVKYGLAAND